MAVKFSNNATTTLSAGESSGSTSLSVNSSANFPPLSTGDYFYVTIDSEVIKVTAVSGTTWTVDSTTDAHTIDSTVELRVTAETLEDVRTETTYTAGNDISITNNVIASTYSHPSEAEHLPSSVSQTEAGYLDGVTSSIQTQMNTKASTGKAIAMAMVFG